MKDQIFISTNQSVGGASSSSYLKPKEFDVSHMVSIEIDFLRLYFFFSTLVDMQFIKPHTLHKFLTKKGN